MTDFQRVSFEATEDALLGQMLERLQASCRIPPQITFFDVGQRGERQRRRSSRSTFRG